MEGPVFFGHVDAWRHLSQNEAQPLISIMSQHNGQTSPAPRVRPCVSFGAKWLLIANCRNSPNIRLWLQPSFAGFALSLFALSWTSDFTFRGQWITQETALKSISQSPSIVNCCSPPMEFFTYPNQKLKQCHSPANVPTKPTFCLFVAGRLYLCSVFSLFFIS